MPVRGRRKNVIIVDLEGTCCDDNSILPHEFETIEIGAVEVLGGKITREFQSFVRPVRHPVLSRFCRELTSISQDEVNGGLLFPHAWTNFCWWCGINNVFYSWWSYDLEQFKRDCVYHGFVMDLKHVNLARVCKKHFGTLSKWRVTKRLGIEFDGTVHRGIDEARHFGKIACKMIEMGMVL